MWSRIQVRGQWWVMHYGNHGKNGTGGNEESVTYGVIKP